MYCQKCGAEGRASFQFCPVCGHGKFGSSSPINKNAWSNIPIGNGVSSVVPQRVSVNVSSMAYAGFWRRLVSNFIDLLVLLGATTVFYFVFVRPIDVVHEEIVLIWFFALSWFAYPTAMQCYKWQATIGQMIMGLVVCDSNGVRLSFLRSFGRNVLDVLSPTVYISNFFIIWTSKKQSLHDLWAGALVMHRGG